MTVYAVTGKGLYQVRFGTYEAARENLAFLGWVEMSRVTSRGAEFPSEVRFFNKLVGGEGRLFTAPDGWVFLAPDGWLMKVYAKLKTQGILTSPSEDARRRKLEEASKTDAGSVLDLFGG